MTPSKHKHQPTQFSRSAPSTSLREVDGDRLRDAPLWGRVAPGGRPNYTLADHRMRQHPSHPAALFSEDRMFVTEELIDAPVPSAKTCPDKARELRAAHLALPASMLLAALMSGCAHGTLSKLDSASQSDWQVCAQSVAKAQCGSTSSEAAANGSTLAFAMCVSPLVDQYAATPKAQRKRWLIRHGCPSEMVED